MDLSPTVSSLNFLSLERLCRNAKNYTNVILQPKAKNLMIPAACKKQILRLSPQDDIATQSLTGEDRGEGAYF